VTYGRANRTQMIRIPGAGRIENRTVDGAANPYLACAVLLAAGLDGIENKIDPGAMNHDNLYEVSESELRKRNIRFLPTTLKEALDRFSEDKLLQEAIGTEYAQYYLRVKSEEWRAYHQSVGAWETENYLKLY
jgi:glutamine synthetase